MSFLKRIWRESIFHQYHVNYLNCVSIDRGPWFWHCNLCDPPLTGKNIRYTFKEDAHGRIV